MTSGSWQTHPGELEGFFRSWLGLSLGELTTACSWQGWRQAGLGLWRKICPKLFLADQETRGGSVATRDRSWDLDSEACCSLSSKMGLPILPSLPSRTVWRVESEVCKGPRRCLSVDRGRLILPLVKGSEQEALTGWQASSLGDHQVSSAGCFRTV